MTQVYAVNCETLCEDAVLQWVLPLLDETRQARVRRLRTPQKRAQCAAAGLLLRHLFGANATVAYAENGKPYLPGKAGTHFNLSHTGNWVFCAVADVPVGIDAQKRTICNNRLAERWFTVEERQWVRAEPDVRFTRLWTRKEAYAKMTGEGMVKSMAGGRGIAYTMKEYTEFVGEDIYITVCAAEDTDFAADIEIVKEPLW